MTDKNTQASKKEFIPQVVRSFYQKATSDFLIGHQFRKIQSLEGQNPLLPPIEAFEHHLPRINHFWELQLLSAKNPPTKPFDLITIHQKLQIRRGELGRWLVLFHQTLDEYEKQGPEMSDFIQAWRQKLKDFQRRFLNSKVLFSAVRD